MSNIPEVKKEVTGDFSKPQKVTILDTKYTEDKDLVEWIVKTTDDKEIVLAWPSSDLGEALGIQGKIEPHHMKKFCQDVKGKTINLVIEGQMKELPNIKDMTNDQIEKISKELDRYCFHEISEELNREIEIDND